MITNFTFYSNPTRTLICVPTPLPSTYSLEDSAHISGVHPEMLRYYSRIGLIVDQRPGDKSGPWFDVRALEEVDRIEHYRRHLGVGRRGLPLVCALRREAERRDITLHFLGED